MVAGVGAGSGRWSAPVSLSAGAGVPFLALLAAGSGAWVWRVGSGRWWLASGVGVGRLCGSVA